jgi:molecular chaperone GrpE (heat shock protein)
LQNKYNDSKFSNIIKLSYNQKDKEERITLSKESNYLVYDFIEKYLKKNKMFNTFNNLSLKLSENRESFINQTLLQQLIALFDYLSAIRLHQQVIEINEIFKVNSTLKFSNILTKHSFVIINHSVTGYYSTKEAINTHVVSNSNNK